MGSGLDSRFNLQRIKKDSKGYLEEAAEELKQSPENKISVGNRSTIQSRLFGSPEATKGGLADLKCTRRGTWRSTQRERLQQSKNQKNILLFVIISFLSIAFTKKMRIIKQRTLKTERSINLQQERIIKIMNYLGEHETASVAELSKLLGVSLVTIRKDLAQMEKDGILSKTRGGAVLSSKKSDSAQRIQIPAELEWIADLAVEQIRPGDFIFLNSGMTCLALAERVKDISGVSVITNNVSAVSVLKPKVQNIILLGGELEQTPDGLITTVDANVGNSLGNIFVNKAFSSGVGIDPEIGLTVNTMGSTYIYKYIPQLCSEWYVMMDTKKFNVKAFYQAASIKQISTLITDVTDQAALNRYREKGLTVLHP